MAKKKKGTKAKKAKGKPAAKIAKRRSASRKQGKAKKSKKATSRGKAKKNAKKGGKTAKRTAKPKKAVKSLAPRPVRTGRGASSHEVGAAFVKLFNGGDIPAIEKNLWSPRVVSVEGMGVDLAWSGRAAVRAKNDEWTKTHTLHGAKAEGPFVGASGFAVRFAMEVEDPSTGRRHAMEEVGVYTVERGKIVREEFMYSV